MKPFLILLVCCFSGGVLRSQYVPPLDGPLLITGTFGELRGNHFHGGLDFRGKVGTPVRAVADGYISRILVSAGGFGQALYVTHPDGKRTVYGHLEVLAPAIHDTVRALQYAGESFALDFHPDSLAFPVRAGQVIGGVGNRGYSFGPHLHFEVWDTATLSQLNPLRLGFGVPDTRNPVVSTVRFYVMRADGTVAETLTYPVSGGSLPDTVVVSQPHVGLAFQAIDRQNTMPNRNGIYRASLRADSAEVFAFRYDSIPYHKTRYVNALTDYAEQQRTGTWYYRLFATVREAVFWSDADTLSSGILRLREGSDRRVTIAAADYAGNEVTFSTVLRLDPTKAVTPLPVRAPHQYYLPSGQRSIIDTGGLRLEVPADALYTDLRFRYQRFEEKSANLLSAVHQLDEASTPLHSACTLTLPAVRPVSERERAAAYVGRCNDDGSYSSVGGQWIAGDRMESKITTLGDYAILLDTVPPRIRIRDFRTDLRGRRGFSLLVDDAVGGALTYRATVDGRWILMELDAKSGTLTHTFDDNAKLSRGPRHDFKLLVRDARGNEATYERSFTR